jgi:hypothetical protein
MAHQIVIDWDDEQVRVLALDRRGSGLKVLAAQVATLDTSEPSAPSLARALEPLVAPHRSPKTETLVVVGGRDVQFRLLRLPPAPLDELPDMVALRSASEFPIADDQGTIDFYPFQVEGAHTQLVMVARIASKSMEMIRQACQQLHLHPLHIVPQGSATAGMAVRERSVCQTGVHVAAVLRQGELDLVGLYQGAAAVIRSVPLPSDDRLEARTLFAVRELRRTQASIASELGVDGIDSIVWHVVGDSDRPLVENVAERLGRPVDTIDLLATQGVETTGVEWPEAAAAFTPLLGIALADLERSQAIDFLAPRRREVKKLPKRTLALAGAAAALFLLGAGYWLYEGVASQQRDAAEKRALAAQINQDIEAISLHVERAKKVEAWLKTDVVWLDEIDRLALAQRPKPVDDKAFDEETDIVLSSIEGRTAGAGRGAGGSLTVKGSARSNEAIRQLDQRLRAGDHSVSSGTILQNSERSKYHLTFDASVEAKPQEGNELR